MVANTRQRSVLREDVPRPGDMLAGKYRVEGVLGAGGMGAVVAALHVDLGQRVAIKLMLPSLLDNQELLARFFREARAAASIQSHHVVRVFDVGRLADGLPYMVMELLEGEDLEHLVRERGPLPVAEAVGYVLEAVYGLAEAHAAGVVHRDLKPGNLFLAWRPELAPVIKILDFGISKTSPVGVPGEGAPLTDTGANLGSPHYMSPEQLESARSVDARTDIYSIGMTLYKLLTDRLAFQADSVGAFLIRVIRDAPTPLRTHRPDAPAALEAVLARCLEKNPDRRFQSASQLAVALSQFTSGEAPRPPPVARRNRTLVLETSSPSLPLVVRAPALTAPASSFGSGSDTVTSAWAPTVSAQAAVGRASASRRTALAVLAGVSALGAVLAVALISYRTVAPPLRSPGPEPSATTSPAAAPAASIGPEEGAAAKLKVTPGGSSSPTSAASSPEVAAGPAQPTGSAAPAPAASGPLRRPGPLRPAAPSNLDKLIKDRR